jgi:hypothetical protein
VKLICNAYPGVEVLGWTRGFEDGRAFAALVDFHHPSVLDYHKDRQESGQERLERVFGLLERCWGIPQFIEPRELVEGTVDEDMVVTLVGTLKNELKYLPKTKGAQKRQTQYQGRSRELLQQVTDAAGRSDRPQVDQLNVAVLRLFQELMEPLDGPAGRECRGHIERGLAGLLLDSVRLCAAPESVLASRLLRRDCMVLAVGEYEASKLTKAVTVADARVHMKLLGNKKSVDPKVLLSAGRELEDATLQISQEARQKASIFLDDKEQQVTREMAQELEDVPVNAVVAKLARNPHDVQAQEEMKELNKEIAAIMSDLELTLSVETSRILERVSEALERGEEANELVEGAIVATRKAARDYPKAQRQAVLQKLDEVDACVSQQDKTQLKIEIAAMRELVKEAEDCYREESAVPAMKDAVSEILVALKVDDKKALMESSALMDENSKRAIELAESRKPHCLNPHRVDGYIQDLMLLQPLHSQNIIRAVESSSAKPDRLLYREVAASARDVLSVVNDLEEASREQENEFSDLQAMALDIDVDMFDLIDQSRDLQAQTKVDSDEVKDLMQMLASEKPEEMKKAIPKLALNLVDRKKENENLRNRQPQDDVIRFGRYARAGADEEVLEGVKQKVVAKMGEEIGRLRAKQNDDPIKQQRVMSCLDELDALLPSLSMGQADELEELQFDLGEMNLDDLMLAAPIDLDAAILSLQEDPNRSASSEPVRLIDQTVLESHQPQYADAEPEMLMQPLEPPAPALADNLLAELEQVELPVEEPEVVQESPLKELTSCQELLAAPPCPSEDVKSVGDFCKRMGENTGHLIYLCQTQPLDVRNVVFVFFF